MPFKIAGAIKLKNQATFHPRKYMLGLADFIINSGNCIFTDSLVYDVQKSGNGFICYVSCDSKQNNTNKHERLNNPAKSYQIKSKYVVMASHYPFINFPGFYFSKMYQSTSYAIAIETSQTIPNGMYINYGEPVLSFRTAKYNDKNLLIIGGGNHKTGYSPESEDFYGYSYLEHEAKRFYPDCKILFKWDTRDCVTLDKVPYIGEFSSLMPNMYVATGFNKWGMTTSNVAANIITSKILGQENPYSHIYDSSRFSPIKNRGEMKNMATQIFHSFISSRLKIPEKDLKNIKRDNGAIIRINGTPVGVYKDIDGNIFTVDPTCTHLRLPSYLE